MSDLERLERPSMSVEESGNSDSAWSDYLFQLRRQETMEDFSEVVQGFFDLYQRRQMSRHSLQLGLIVALRQCETGLSLAEQHFKGISW